MLARLLRSESLKSAVGFAGGGRLIDGFHQASAGASSQGGLERFQLAEPSGIAASPVHAAVIRSRPLPLSRESGPDWLLLGYPRERIFKLLKATTLGTQTSKVAHDR